MTTPFWCLLIAIVIPYVLAGTGGFFRMRQFGTVDNKSPRAQSARLEGLGARVYAAQQNSWEALPVFATSVFVAHLAGADASSSALAAELFVVARVLHAACYIANLDALRSLVFLGAFGCCIWLFVLAAVA